MAKTTEENVAELFELAIGVANATIGFVASRAEMARVNEAMVLILVHKMLDKWIDEVKNERSMQLMLDLADQYEAFLNKEKR